MTMALRYLVAAVVIAACCYSVRWPTQTLPAFL